MATIDSDMIEIKNLQLPAGVVAPDIWGNKKAQPALVSVVLLLHGKGFSSAASKDELDDSTIHYGQLAKSIRAKCSRAEQTVGSVIKTVHQVIGDMSNKGTDSSNPARPKPIRVVAQSIIKVTLPKASMAGESVSITSEWNYVGDGFEPQWHFAVDDVKVMTLVGVNKCERTAKQPLIVSLRISWTDVMVDDSDDVEFGDEDPLFGLEVALVKIIEETAFETLETLINHTMTRLQENPLPKMPQGSTIRLRIEKPRAIAYADAPAVEALRHFPIPGREGRTIPSLTSGSSKVTESSGATKLAVIKPYLQL